MELLPLLIFPLLMAVGGLYDLTTLTIPNWVSGLLIAAFFVMAFSLGLGWGEIGLAASVFAVTLVLGMVGFAMGWFGGGDAKFLAATSLWFGFPMALHFVVATLMLGGLAAVLLIFFRRLALPGPVAEIGWVKHLHHPETGLPYGTAIAAAGLLLMSKLPFLAAVVG